MAELDQNQTDTGTADAVTPTLLREILDGSAADVPAQEQDSADTIRGIADILRH